MSEELPDFLINGERERHFHAVISLHEETHLEWDKISQMIPVLPRGWFELARLSLEDRIEFTHNYWQAKLSLIDLEELHFHRRLDDFFNAVDEIGIFATQVTKESNFEVHMMYGLKDADVFFQGSPPASHETLERLRKQFGHICLPPDYLAFLQIHDGFSKYMDTGTIKSRDMAQTYQRLQHLFSGRALIGPDGWIIDVEHLIPFYESFLHDYQCFYADWSPGPEIGNIYFSGNNHSVSNFLESHHPEESFAFPNFLSWLIFYLEDLWHPQPNQS